MRKLIGPLVSVHRLVFFISDRYRFFDLPIRTFKSCIFIKFIVYCISTLVYFDGVCLQLEEDKRSVEEDLKKKKNALALQLASCGDQCSSKVGGLRH